MYLSSGLIGGRVEEASYAVCLFAKEIAARLSTMLSQPSKQLDEPTLSVLEPQDVFLQS